MGSVFLNSSYLLCVQQSFMVKNIKIQSRSFQLLGI